MEKFRGKLYAVVLMLLMIGGASACASKAKAAAGPDANRAAEAKQSPETAQAAGNGSAEMPSQEAKHRQEAETERLRQLERDRLKKEEVANIAAANSLTPENLTKVFFDFDRYEIKKDFRAPLEHDASTINNHAGTKVVVEGYCDERGSDEYNLALGERRATAVKKYLVSLGVNKGQLHTISYGEERPANDGHDENAWSRNRRVQFSLE